MNKKLIYTGIWLCLGGFALTNSAWADPNKQSTKKCEFEASDADVVLTKKLQYGRVDAGVLPLDPIDDVYIICHDDTFTGECQVTDPDETPLAIETTDPTKGIPFIDPATGDPVPVLDQNGQPVLDQDGNPVPKLYIYNGLHIMGSNRADVIEGTLGNDWICGQNGNDTIDGLDGNDNIQGNNGNDTETGGPGNDHVYGGNGSDGLYGYDQNDSDDLDEVEDVNLDGKIDDADIIDDEDTMEGGNGNDELSGGPNHDDLSGGNGNDRLYGGGGRDDLHGDNGTDYLDGGEGIADLNDGGRGKNTCADPDIGDCQVAQPKGKKGGKK